MKTMYRTAEREIRKALTKTLLNMRREKRLGEDEKDERNDKKSDNEVIQLDEMDGGAT